jgi:NAD(P)-dependent dehydrogenase (short-subunit alcohol dehydrogenase family)
MSMTGLFDLTGRVALLTGASRGMGKQMALGLARQGATVVISSRKQDQLDLAADEIWSFRTWLRRSAVR